MSIVAAARRHARNEHLNLCATGHELVLQYTPAGSWSQSRRVLLPGSGCHRHSATATNGGGAAAVASKGVANRGEQDRTSNESEPGGSDASGWMLLAPSLQRLRVKHSRCSCSDSVTRSSSWAKSPFAHGAMLLELRLLSRWPCVVVWQ